MRDNRSLYIGRLVGDCENELRQVFGQFGRLESVKLFAAKGFGFVKYVQRGAAEFAREAGSAKENTFRPAGRQHRQRTSNRQPNIGRGRHQTCMT